MVSTQKIRINNLAKDLNMKSKDLLEALTKSGVAGKTSTGTLDPVEFSLLFDSITTDNQIKNMEDSLLSLWREAMVLHLVILFAELCYHLYLVQQLAWLRSKVFFMSLVQFRELRKM